MAARGFNQNPENNMFSGAFQQSMLMGYNHRLHPSITFFHPDYTVGSGVTPDHAG